jgi:hypothetical protein
LVVAERLVATDFPAISACFSSTFRARRAFVSNDQIQSYLKGPELLGVVVFLGGDCHLILAGGLSCSVRKAARVGTDLADPHVDRSSD